MSRILIGTVLAGSLLLGKMSLAQGGLREQRLPENVERLFTEAIDAQPPGVQRPEAPELNRVALRKLKDAPWPDVRDLPRVKVTTGGEKPRELRAWLVEETDSGLVLLYDNFNLGPLPKAQLARCEAADYAAELRKLLSRHAAVDRNTHVIPFFDRAEMQVPLLGDAALVLHAYCALVRGHDAEAKRLLAAGLDRYPPALDTIYKQWSWSLFHRGVVLLQDGSPRAKVAAEWRHALAAFPESVYTEQLREYLTQLD